MRTSSEENDMSTQISRREPFVTVPSIERLIQSVFGEPAFAAIPAALEEGTLAVDVSEDEKHVIVRASLPGFDKKDVTIEVHDGVLTINAQHTEEKEEKGERFYRKERRVGSVSRRIALPAPVADEGAKADLRDGVLTVRVPKHAQASPRRVQID